MDNDQIQGTADKSQMVGESENQPEPMPSSNQKQTEQVDANLPDMAAATQLPDEAKDRTRKEFEKLLDENRQLKSKIQKQNYGTSVFDSFRPTQTLPQQPAPQVRTENSSNGYLNQRQVDSIASQFVDEEGNVDINGLNNALSSAENRAQQAMNIAQKSEERLVRFEESQQAKEAHAIHTWLDPEQPDFDSVKFELVRDRLLREKYYEGKELSLLEAANQVLGISGANAGGSFNLNKVKEDAINAYKQGLTVRKQQAPLESGKGEPRQLNNNLQELRERTRRGDQNALAERLRNIGVIKSDA